MSTKLDKIINSVNTAELMTRSLSEWKSILARECQVFVVNENYLAKRFDQINYKFCEVDEARQVLIDNLYALLRYKYFTKIDDEAEKRITEIVKFFTTNLKTSLIRASFDFDTDAEKISFLENGQVAFRNGVFDFKKNDWLFKYTVINIPEISNNIYVYPTQYIVQWYFNFNFDPFPLNVNEFSVEDFLDFMKDWNKENRNYCFELLYNMSHDESHKFSIKKFKHLCEILGYSLLQTFSQNFVLLIGSGQNGKNSLFDGCFTNRLVPRPAANSLDEIEEDKFVTGTLENVAHNIFLETSAKTYTESKMIKALTGSMYQTVQNKGVSKYSSIINCKYIFAGNDQDKIKFSDNTNGFRRRINIYEIFYRWDPMKNFLKRGDYFDTSFSDDLHELKNDILNTIVYIYFGIYGILSATKNFEGNFKFTANDWKLNYSDIDFDLKECIENVTLEKIATFIKSSTKNYSDGRSLLYDLNREKLYLSKTIKNVGVHNFEDMVKMFSVDEESCLTYFSEYDVYIDLKLLQSICNYNGPSANFISSIKKLYQLTDTVQIGSRPCIKVGFVNNKLRVIV